MEDDLTRSAADQDADPTAGTGLTSGGTAGRLGWHRIGRVQKGIATIVSGVAGGHLILLIATPILSRIYTPAAYGAFAAIMSIVAIATPAASLMLQSAIPIATEAEGRQLVKIGACSSVLFGVLCAFLVSTFSQGAYGGNAALGSALVVYLVWITAMYGILAAYALRAKRYGAIARRNLMQSAGTVVGQIGFSRLLPTGLGLTAGLSLGRSFGVLGLARESQILSRPLIPQEAPTLKVLRKYWRFPVVFTPSVMLNVLGMQIPILLVARVYGPASAGNLSQALLFGAIPSALLGQAVSNVVMAEMAARVREGESNQRSRYLRVSKALLPIGIAWFLFLVIVASPLLPIFLGPQWGESGDFLTALAIMAASALVVSPLSSMLVIYQRAILNLFLDAGRAVIVASLGVAAWQMGLSAPENVLCMSLGMFLVYCVTWVLSLKTVSRTQ